MNKSATFSPCRKYRYMLWRHWGGLFNHGCAMFIGLNPSTADEILDDPTIRRCIGYAHDWGYAELYMANIFAFRAILPKDMKAADDPIGPDNDQALVDMASLAGVIVAAWGNNGAYQGHGEAVRKMIPNLSYLKLTKNGSPAHPLYLPKGLNLYYGKIKMKCPICGSDKYTISENDPDLMLCSDCHAFHSVAWSKGYWMGFIEGEKKGRRAAFVEDEKNYE